LSIDNIYDLNLLLTDAAVCGLSVIESY